MKPKTQYRIETKDDLKEAYDFFKEKWVKRFSIEVELRHFDYPNYGYISCFENGQISLTKKLEGFKKTENPIKTKKMNSQNELVLTILNLGKEGYKNHHEKYSLEQRANKLIENHISEVSKSNSVENCLPKDPNLMAEYLHDSYEQIAKIMGWETQSDCKVDFKDLPIENKNTMVLLASKIIFDFGSNTSEQ